MIVITTKTLNSLELKKLLVIIRVIVVFLKYNKLMNSLHIIKTLLYKHFFELD